MSLSVQVVPCFNTSKGQDRALTCRSQRLITPTVQKSTSRKIAKVVVTAMQFLRIFSEPQEHNLHGAGARRVMKS
jgi:hypothetical protein